MGKFYWAESDIPALRGLSSEERRVAKRRVQPDVWRHWQVWLPAMAFVATCAALFLNARHFQGHSSWAVAVVIAVGRLAPLPYYYFLQKHLAQGVVAER